MQVGVDLALEADPAAVYLKSRQLGELFYTLMLPLCDEWGFTLASPPCREQRGSQICYAHPKGYAIVQVRHFQMTTICPTDRPLCAQCPTCCCRYMITQPRLPNMSNTVHAWRMMGNPLAPLGFRLLTWHHDSIVLV